jgi:hypothetical protein
MTKIKKMTLHANGSVMKGADREISCSKHKSLNFRLLLVAVFTVIATGSFFIACSSEDPFLESRVNDVGTEMQQILGDHLTVENNRYDCYINVYYKR